MSEIVLNIAAGIIVMVIALLMGADYYRNTKVNYSDISSYLVPVLLLVVFSYGFYRLVVGLIAFNK